MPFYLSSSKAIPNRPSGRINRTRIMIDQGHRHLQKGPCGEKENHQCLSKPQNISAYKTSLDAAQPTQDHDGHHHDHGFHPTCWELGP